ncbi:29107_t:CDS:2 [Racocetra persica]|uniref:29107_t:CDS:1 n=1 Tax=Racocetra persica TaxID=160502 RepID=A0ACA9NSR9_9GLOM|nr:29107_t:CDS:2 [Racocetra persica]
MKNLGVNQLIPLIIVLKAKGLQSKKESSILQKLIIYSFRKKTKGQTFQKSDVLKWTWEEFKQKTFLQFEKNELNLLEKSVLLPKDIDDRKKWLIQQFKKTGMLFIDEEKEKSQQG